MSLFMLSTDMSFSLARKLELLPLKWSLSTPSLCTPSSSAVANKACTCTERACFNGHRSHVCLISKTAWKWQQTYLSSCTDLDLLEELLQINSHQAVERSTESDTWASVLSFWPNWANVRRPVDSSETEKQKPESISVFILNYFFKKHEHVSI